MSGDAIARVPIVTKGAMSGTDGRMARSPHSEWSGICGRSDKTPFPATGHPDNQTRDPIEIPGTLPWIKNTLSFVRLSHPGDFLRPNPPLSVCSLRPKLQESPFRTLLMKTGNRKRGAPPSCRDVVLRHSTRAPFIVRLLIAVDHFMYNQRKVITCHDAEPADQEGRFRNDRIIKTKKSGFRCLS